MDEKDLLIISELKANARISNQDLSHRVGLSPTPCFRRVRQLEDAGVIQGYTAIVDEEACGLSITAFVRVRLQVHSQVEVGAFEYAIQNMDAVTDCYVTTGNADYLLRVLVGSLKDYERFVRTQLHTVPGVASINTTFCYGQVKRSSIAYAKRSTD